MSDYQEVQSSVEANTCLSAPDFDGRVAVDMIDGDNYAQTCYFAVDDLVAYLRGIGFTVDGQFRTKGMKFPLFKVGDRVRDVDDYGQLATVVQASGDPDEDRPRIAVVYDAYEDPHGDYHPLRLVDDVHPAHFALLEAT